MVSSRYGTKFTIVGFRQRVITRYRTQFVLVG